MTWPRTQFRRMTGLRILHQLRALTLPTLTALANVISSVFESRAALQLENLALRHQLGVLHRSVKKPKLTPINRCSGLCVSHRPPKASSMS
jgi:hypothetical protein